MGYALCADIGGTQTRVGIGNEEGLVSTNRVSTSEVREPGDLIELLEDLTEESGIDRSELVGLGIASTGLVDVEEKRVVKAHNFRTFDFRPVGGYFGLPVRAENDANAAALGERFYGGNETENLAYITIGTGIGAGFFYGGRLLRSTPTGSAGEVGHCVINAADSPGTWTSYCSGRGIADYVRRLLEDENRDSSLKYVEELRTEDVFRHTREGDEVARDYVERIAKYNAAGLVTVINSMHPQVMVLGGSVVLNNPEFLEKSREMVHELAVNPVPEMELTDLGDDAGLYGALRMGLSEDW